MKSHTLLIVPALLLAACSGAPRAGSVPAALGQAEEWAEDIQSDLNASVWSAAGEKASGLASALPALRAIVARGAARDGRGRVEERAALATYQTAVDSLTAQVKRRDRLAALFSANALSRSLLTLLAPYAERIPVQVAFLDVAGRDAVYDAEAGRWPQTVAALAELSRNYAAVTPHVASRDAALDGRFATELSRLGSAVAAQDVRAVESIGGVLLEDVDAIERTY